LAFAGARVPGSGVPGATASTGVSSGVSSGQPLGSNLTGPSFALAPGLWQAAGVDAAAVPNAAGSRVGDVYSALLAAPSANAIGLETDSAGGERLSAELLSALEYGGLVGSTSSAAQLGTESGKDSEFGQSGSGWGAWLDG
jgi:hypothetical protein